MVEYSKINIRTWSMAGASGTLGIAMYEMVKEDLDFAVVTSDLCFFSGLDRLKSEYPDKVYNVGIAEQNMIGIAAGMAKEGMHIWATTYASFASARVLDQVKVNMGYMKLPVHLVGLTAGLSVGILGATHMAIEDIAIMRAIPNIIILSPADCHETMKMIMAASKIEKPVYLRLAGTTRTPIVYADEYEIKIGKANLLYNRCGAKVCIIATGSMVYSACKVAEQLELIDILCDVYDCHTIKPFDRDILMDNLDKDVIVTIEEHSMLGGLGSIVAEQLAPIANSPRHLIIGIEDNYPHAASYEKLLERCGLSVETMVDKIEQFVKM